MNVGPATMGVSITAYSHIKFLQKEFDEDYDTDKETYLWQPSFPERSNGFLEGHYEFSSKLRIADKSYGGYNKWREQLCRIVHGFNPKYLWDHADLKEFQKLPFFELIHFSDCEGFLGPVTCSHILRDFKSNETLLRDNNLNDLDEWIIGLELAALTGVVRFS